MIPPEEFETIPVKELKNRVGGLHEQGCRLVQISATNLGEQLQLMYSFDLNGRLMSLRVQLPRQQACVPSISSIYWCAFIYENEIHDLFDVEVSGMAVDFKGKFYQTAVKHPFGPATARQANLDPSSITASTAAPASGNIVTLST